MSLYLTGQYENSDFLKSILETAIDAILIINTRGIIIILNQSAAKLFGYEKDELIGKNISVLTPEPHKSNHDTYIENHLRTGINKIIGIGREVQGVKKDGSSFPVRLAVSKFIINEEIYFTGVVHDLSSQKEVENKLWQLNKDLENLVDSRTGQLQESINQLSTSNKNLEQEINFRRTIESKLKIQEKELIAALEKERDLNQLKSRFVSIASHEFRTPLANILSSLNLIEKYEDSDALEKRKKHISKIKNNIHYLNGVLNEFLILTRLEETSFQLKLEEFSLYSLLFEITEDFNHLKKNQQTIKLNCESQENFIIRSDKTCIKHIINNLVSNAIKFSDEYSEITISLEQIKDKFIIIVADNGIGIPEDEQRFIFDIFYRASNVLNIQGTGLGLNIVKKYLDSIHGDIKFESKEGQGTKITIQLPKA